MKKCRIIATCLLNAGYMPSREQGELTVRNIFAAEYPGDDFDRWNEEMLDSAAESVVKDVGKASTINVRNFIRDLW
jgi:hypothetical protein